MAKKVVAESKQLRSENEELKERVDYADQETGMMKSTSERELSK